MIKKVVKKYDLREYDEIRLNLEYWLSKTPAERVAAVEFLRRQVHGSLPRLQRTVKVVQQKQD